MFASSVRNRGDRGRRAIPFDEAANSQHAFPSLGGLYLPEAIKIAKEAGQIILDVKHRGDFDTTFKGDNSPVTVADHQASQHIVNALENLNSHIPVVSEENYKEALKQFSASWLRQKDQATARDILYWAVDPLDGTQSFLNGKKDYAVHIALMMGGQPLLGVVYCPEHDTTYYATRDTHSYKKVGESDATRIHTKRHGDNMENVAFLNAHPRDKMVMYSKKRDILLRDYGVHLPPTPMIETEFPPAMMLAEGLLDAIVKIGRNGVTAGKPWDNEAYKIIIRRAGGALVDLVNFYRSISDCKGAREAQHAYMAVGDRNFRDENFEVHPSLRRNKRDILVPVGMN